VGPRGLPGRPGASAGGGGFDDSKLREFYGNVQGVVRRASDASYVAGATVRLMADKKVSAGEMPLRALAPCALSPHASERCCGQSNPVPTAASPYLRRVVVTCCPSQISRQWLA
jgi:hypothetical protein